MEKALPDLAVLSGGRPMVLVFAASDRAPDFQNQVDLLQDERETFEQADVVVATIMSEGASHVGADRLDSAQVASLRARFGVATEDFAVVAVDVTAAVRHRDDAPVQPRVLLQKLR